MVNEKDIPKRLFTPLILINILLFVIVLANSFYFFYIKKDFDFMVETSCDTSKEECFLRDCSDPDSCPPNGLTEFKRYTLNANSFKYCENEDCKIACEGNQINCENIPCEENPEMGESCSILQLEQETLNY